MLSVPLKIVVEDMVHTILEMKAKEKEREIVMTTIPVSVNGHDRLVTLKPLQFPPLIRRNEQNLYCGQTTGSSVSKANDVLTLLSPE